jgi:very-short-patch-repair endonuclease
MAVTMSKIAKLCKYYLECIRHDYLEVSAFASSRHQPDYAELEILPYKASDANEAFKSPAASEIRAIASRPNNNKDLYWGYPCRLVHLTARSGWTGFKVEPLFVFKVQGDTRETPKINFKALEGLLDAGTGSRFMEAAVELSEELGLGTEYMTPEDLDKMFRSLSVRFPGWPRREAIDPDQILIQKPFREFSDPSEAGIYNRPVLILAEKSRYTAGLESELVKLAAIQDDEELAGTALYDWINIKTGDVIGESNVLDPLLEVVPLNEEQRLAVQNALTERLTVVTGPPGTGKSQVVTSVLVNAAWRGQKTLFSSKNNKAVDVVEARTNALAPRSVLLRLGSGDFQSKLCDYLSGLLNARVQPDDKRSFEEVKKIYERVIDGKKKHDQVVEQVLKDRNLADALEQETENLRTALGAELFSTVRVLNMFALDQERDKLQTEIERCDRRRQKWVTRIVWPFSKKKRYQAFDAVKDGYGGLLASIGLPAPAGALDDVIVGEWVALIDKGRLRIDQIKNAKEYFDALTRLSAAPGAGEMATQSIGISQELTNISRELWVRWLALQPDRMTRDQRRMIGEFVAILKLIVDANHHGRLVGRPTIAKYHVLFAEVAHFLPCWAITALTAKSKIPFQKAYFDLVVIDEASQCDIASILPLLYRSKRAMIIGDPRQLSHITSVTSAQDMSLFEKLDEPSIDYGWVYSANSLFARAQGLCDPKFQVTLRDHHRSRKEIIEFSNQCFYAEAPLRIATAYERLAKNPDALPVVRWQHIAGAVRRPANGGAVNQVEADAVVDELRRLMNLNYRGSIGVVTPFRAQANAIKDLVHSDGDLVGKLELRDFLVDVVHSFQGDERDLMIFSPTISAGVHPGAIHFLKNNGNLFNVAITRARSTLIVVGDKATALQSGVDYLEKFARYTEKLAQGEIERVAAEADRQYGPEYPAVSADKKVSEWERVLYRALYAAGIRTMPQYAEDKYELDLALKIGNRKLDIEVDGEMYHRAWDGELCRRDQMRNRRLIELGWDVIRFWVYEVRDDLPGCVNKVRAWAQHATKSE